MQRPNSTSRSSLQSFGKPSVSRPVAGVRGPLGFRRGAGGNPEGGPFGISCGSIRPELGCEWHFVPKASTIVQSLQTKVPKQCASKVPTLCGSRLQRPKSSANSFNISVFSAARTAFLQRPGLHSKYCLSFPLPLRTFQGYTNQNNWARLPIEPLPDNSAQAVDLINVAQGPKYL